LAFLGAVMPSFSAAPFTCVLVILVPAFGHVGPIESAVDRLSRSWLDAGRRTSSWRPKLRAYVSAS
jgi:hypothetical protein